MPKQPNLIIQPERSYHMISILYTVAKDTQGNLIKAQDADKGKEYFCPVCQAKLILRKSGNTGKGSKRPHFAHQTVTPNCTPETALHYAFKNLLAEKLRQHITATTPLPFTWNCEYCGSVHSGNLLKKIKAVKVEYHLTVCQPDIALLEEDGRVFAVIEVVVTHKPEPQVLEFYEDNDIILIQINLRSDEDIDGVENRIAQPDRVKTCFHPPCRTCGQHLEMLTMMIIDGPCWKCGSTMKLATLSGSKGGYVRGTSNHIGPQYFTEEEIAFARNKGVLLKIQYSRTVGDEYLANSCRTCGSFTGDHYLFTDYIMPAADGTYRSQTFEIGYHCEHCYDNKQNDGS